jgi:chromosomal replication initiation ATPase DnaA
VLLNCLVAVVRGGAKVVLARTLAIHLARKRTTMSYPEIAGALGRGTHSTVITAAQRMERQLAENPPVILASTGEEIRLADLAERLKNAIARA